MAKRSNRSISTRINRPFTSSAARNFGQPSSQYLSISSIVTSASQVVTTKSWTYAVLLKEVPATRFLTVESLSVTFVPVDGSTSFGGASANITCAFNNSLGQNSSQQTPLSLMSPTTIVVRNSQPGGQLATAAQPTANLLTVNLIAVAAATSYQLVIKVRGRLQPDTTLNVV
jgi:hypothetical protein